MVRIAIALALLLAFPATALAQASFSIDSADAVYNESFNGLGEPSGTFTNADQGSPSLNYWYAESEVTNPVPLDNDDGNTIDTSLYSYGFSGQVDRAFGLIAEPTLGDMAIGARFTNNTGATISRVIITYTGEHWHESASGGTMVLFHRVGGTTFDLVSTPGDWVQNTVGGFSVPAATGGGALNGNDPDNQTDVAVGVCLRVPDGDSFWIGWWANGTASDQPGMAVDNLSLWVETIDNDDTVFGEDFSSYVNVSEVFDNDVNPGTAWTKVNDGNTLVVEDGALDVDLTELAGAERDLCPDDEFTFDDSNDTLLVISLKLTLTELLPASTELAILSCLDETNTRGQLWLSSDGSSVHNLGVSLNAVSPDQTLDSIDLAVDTEYVVVVIMDMSNGMADPRIRLGVNPTGNGTPAANWVEADPAVTIDTPIERFRLFGGSEASGAYIADDVWVGSSFTSGIAPSDVTVSADTPSDATAEADATDVVVASYGFSADPDTPQPTLNSLTLTASGTGNDSADVTTVTLYRDDGGTTGELDATDTELDSGSFSSDDGTLELTVGDELTDTEVDYLVVYDFGDSFENNQTFACSLTALDLTLGTTISLPLGSATITADVETPDGGDTGGDGDGDDDNGGTAWPVALLIVALATAAMALRRQI